MREVERESAASRSLVLRPSGKTVHGIEPGARAHEAPMFAGSGSGPQTADGCSVEMYRRFPYLGELEPVRQFLVPGTTVLELGCGVGRQTRVLLAWGLRPTAVDNSPEMLSHLPAGARPILSSIETLSLKERFSAVILASCLVNHPLPAVRALLLASAARHLQPDGYLLLERLDLHWLQTAEVGCIGQRDGASVYLEAIHRSNRAARIRLRYEIGLEVWHHELSAEPLSEEQIAESLEVEGLNHVSWHGPNGCWVVAGRGLHDAA